MAKCEDCHRDMGLAPTCIEMPVIIARPDYVRLRHPASETRRCYDCNVQPGGVHHGGCEQERCPRCGGQLIMCSTCDSLRSIVTVDPAATTLVSMTAADGPSSFAVGPAT